ncbi:MAG: two-component system response regulator CreB [Desulfobacterales bacterium]|nr:MAG: two-component system response regulator CreB [Desulfobacterales bacterium]
MKPKILIIEDEPAITETIRYALETDGFETHCLSSGMPVISLLAKEAIDLIILDIGLPDINGLELCKEIRKAHTLPIIFLTARADEVDRVVGLEIGADDYVVKPFSPRELSARIKAVLRRTQQPAVAAPSNQAFQLDESKRQISYFGTPVELSRYEYNLLKILIHRPGQVYSRDQLMELAWDEPDASMDRTVDAHVKNIRSKLKTIKPEIDPIITHRGIGYALKEDL